MDDENELDTKNENIPNTEADPKDENNDRDDNDLHGSGDDNNIFDSGETVNPNDPTDPTEPPTEPSEDPKEEDGEEDDPEPEDPEEDPEEDPPEEEGETVPDWINQGQTRLISGRNTDFTIEEKSQEDTDQASNQDKLDIQVAETEDGIFTIELTGRLSFMSRWTSTDSAHADKPSPWYGIEFYFYEDPVNKIKFNGNYLQESDIVDKDKNSIILWLDLDNLVEKSTIFTLEKDGITETFRINFTNTDVNVNVDPSLFPDINVTPTGPDINIGDNVDPGFGVPPSGPEVNVDEDLIPGFGQEYVVDPERKRFDWINLGQTRLIKKTYTSFEIEEKSPEGKSQTANQNKLTFQPEVDEDGIFTIELTGRLSFMSRWTSTDPGHAGKLIPWYGIEFLFYDSPVNKVKFNGSYLQESDIVNKENNSIILWLDLENLTKGPITFTLESNEVKETFSINYNNRDEMFQNPLVKVIHISVRKNDDTDTSQDIGFAISDSEEEDTSFNKYVTVEEIINKLSDDMTYRKDDERYIYTFGGLSESEDGDEILDKDHKITEDTVLYAHWFQFNITNDINITVHKNDGTEEKQQITFVDHFKNDEDDVTVKLILSKLTEGIKTRSDDEKNIYNFVGLAETPDATEPLNEDYRFINDQDLYLIWVEEAKATQFKITVNKNDSSDEVKEFEYTDYDYTDDDNVTVAKIIDSIRQDPDGFFYRKDDEIYEYTFKGLSYTSDGFILPEETRIVSDKELYIIWERKSKVKTIRVTVYKNDEDNDVETLIFEDVLDDPSDDVTGEKILEVLSGEMKYRSDVDDYAWEWKVLGLSYYPDITSPDDMVEPDTRITNNAVLYLIWDYVPNEQLQLINQIKIKKVIKKLNKKFYTELYECSKMIKTFTENNSLYQIFDKVRANDNHYAEMFANIYNKLVKVFSVLFYTVNISDIIAKNESDLKCYPYEIAKWFLDNNLSKADSLQNFVGIKQYFVKDVASKIFTENFYENYDRFLSLEHPVIDEIETGNINFPIEQVIFHFAENLFNFRELMRNTDFYWQEANISDDSYMNSYGLFLYCVINFMQLFYMESYLSNNKFPVRTQVKNIIKAFIPDCDGFVTYEDIVSFIQITT